MIDKNFSPQKLSPQEVLNIKNQTQINIFRSQDKPYLLSSSKKKKKQYSNKESQKQPNKPSFGVRTYQNQFFNLKNQKTNNSSESELINQSISKLEKKMLSQLQVNNYENNNHFENNEHNDIENSPNQYQQDQLPKRIQRLEQYKQNVLDRYQNFQSLYQNAYQIPKTAQNQYRNNFNEDDKNNNSNSSKNFYSILNYSHANNNNNNYNNSLQNNQNQGFSYTHTAQKKYRAKSVQQKDNYAYQQNNKSYQNQNDISQQYQQQENQQYKNDNDNKNNILDQTENNQQKELLSLSQNKLKDEIVNDQNNQQDVDELQNSKINNQNLSNNNNNENSKINDSYQNLLLLQQSEQQKLLDIQFNFNGGSQQKSEQYQQNLQEFQQSQQQFLSPNKNLGELSQSQKNIVQFQNTDNNNFTTQNIQNLEHTNPEQKNKNFYKTHRGFSTQNSKLNNKYINQHMESSPNNNNINKLKLNSENQQVFINRNSVKGNKLKKIQNVNNSPIALNNLNTHSNSQKKNFDIKKIKKNNIRLHSVSYQGGIISNGDDNLHGLSRKEQNQILKMELGKDNIYKQQGSDYEYNSINFIMNAKDSSQKKQKKQIIKLNNKNYTQDYNIEQELDPKIIELKSNFIKEQTEKERTVGEYTKTINNFWKEFKIYYEGLKYNPNFKRIGLDMKTIMEEVEDFLKNFQIQLSNKNQEILNLNDKIKQKESEMEQESQNQTQERQKLKEEMEQKQNKYDSNEQNYLKNINELQQQDKNNIKTIDDLNLKVRDYENQVSNQNKRISDLKSEISQKIESFKILNEEKLKLEIESKNEKQTLQQNLENLQNTIQQNQKEFDSFQNNKLKEIENQTQVIKDLSLEIQNLKQLVNEKQSKIYFINDLVDIESTITQNTNKQIQGSKLIGQNTGKIYEYDFLLNLAEIPKNIRLIILTISKNQDLISVWKNNNLDFRRNFTGIANVYQKGKIVDYQQLKNFDQNEYEFMYLVNNGNDWQIKKTDLKKETYDVFYIQYQAKKYLTQAGVKLSQQLQQALDWNLESKYSIKLKPGDIIPMPNLSYDEFTIGLGWDVDEGEIDCDASVIFFNEEKKYIGQVDFETGKSKEGAVIHQGDNRSGDKEGDDEEIIVHLDKLDQEIYQIWVLVSIYDDGKYFDSVTESYARFVIKGKEFLKFDIIPEKIGKKNGLLMCNLEKHGERWICKGRGAFCEGVQCVEQVIPFIQPFLNQE
ncbi:hypothetical protein PPERSA_05011 [Pseudocohnilembus persalinus]|uniref:TerD domain-containing protein n=1 Tax=Pseudocohnilembus persalinus TaxID=266149 RepID=A0A0V0QW03_PSEPJ|nr:hypothetical protein PPERSA_05011 [Pseudocohnilembus persalinus]|eukprot:KRX06398.1 hypothetical protein PPERSA_05011 [Pseudocohnilembus persalinus]